MKDYRGYVSGLDVHALVETQVRCFAFIVFGDPGDEIQVVAYEGRLQSALELASAKKSEVEVYYEDNGTEKILSRVRLLDR